MGTCSTSRFELIPELSVGLESMKHASLDRGHFGDKSLSRND